VPPPTGIGMSLWGEMGDAEEVTLVFQCSFEIGACERATSAPEALGRLVGQAHGRRRHASAAGPHVQGDSANRGQRSRKMGEYRLP
jgi:hypothetical protein